MAPPVNVLTAIRLTFIFGFHSFFHFFPTLSSKNSGGGMGGIFQIGKSTHKKINKQDVNINFADVAGCDEAKKEIMEFVVSYTVFYYIA